MKKILVSLTVLFMISCNQKSAKKEGLINSKEAIELTSKSTSIIKDITESKKYEGKEVELIGSFSISGVLLKGNNKGLLQMRMEGLDVWVPVNKESNSAWLPNKKEFLDKEVKLIDNKGKDFLMQTFPIFKVKCKVDYEPDTKPFKDDGSKVSEIRKKIRAAGGNKKQSLINPNVTVQTIEWLGNRSYEY